MLGNKWPTVRLAWIPIGSGWTAELHLPDDAPRAANDIADAVYTELTRTKANHPIMEWERFLGKAYTDEQQFLRSSALTFFSESNREEHLFAPIFTSQSPATQGDTMEHFDHPFRAARKDYYVGNLKSVLGNTELEHIVRTLVQPWDYRDAMANQSLRLDHGDDRRHAYQWHAPTEDPTRHKSGCMLGANRLAIEAFPLFPCLPTAQGNTAVGFICKSKILTWITWPVWERPCSVSVISSLLNLTELNESEPRLSLLKRRGIVALMRSRRFPIEKNKVFLPPEQAGS